MPFISPDKTTRTTHPGDVFANAKRRTQTAKVLVIPALLVQVFFFLYIAHHRFIDGDEGAFLLSARLVLAHKKPYLDFFYNQAPLLPYAYAIWMKVTTTSWDAGRTFSALLTTLLGLLVFGHVCRETKSWLAGAFSVVLFCSSTLVFAWYTVVKVHCLAALFIFGAYSLLTWSLGKSPGWLVISGMLLGLGIDSRSFVLLVAPLFLWWIFRNVNSIAKLSSLLWFVAGIAIGTLPALYFFLSSPHVFVFDNLGYHSIRSNEGLIGWWQQKLVVFVRLFLGGPSGNGLQWSILFFVALGFISSERAKPYAPRFAFQIAVLLLIIGLLPTPTYAQYFCLCMPFLVVSAVCPVTDFLAELQSRRDRVLGGAVIVCIVVAYVALGYGDIRKYLVTGDGVPGVRSALDRSDWRLASVNEVSQAIDHIVRPGEIVASFWPGDIFQTHAMPLPGLENPFALPISDRLTPLQRAEYHIISPAEVMAGFANHTPRIVVLPKQLLSALTPQDLLRMEDLRQTFILSLRNHGYSVVRSVGGVSIYVCSCN